jgi:hypothetical protein
VEHSSKLTDLLFPGKVQRKRSSLHLASIMMEGAAKMIFACKKHVKEGLNIMDLPHIHTINENDSLFVQNACCHVCGMKANYKLFNYFSQRRTKQVI